jgi:CDP-glycerol glycerophosphotransferase (TagB/SpsB family)
MTIPTRSAAATVALSSVGFDFAAPALLFEGTGTIGTFALLGSRQELPGQVAPVDGGWRARVPLLLSRFGGPELAPRSGHYSLLIDGSIATADGVELPAPQLIEGVARVSITATADGVTATFAPPLTDRERGPQQQAALESDYRATAFEPIDAVFFESFFGRNASCNPLAIDRALATLRPDVARYWSVTDASVAVPDGAIALIEGSAEWWRIRGSARLLIVNDWLRKRYKRRRHQKVLQTWHGTMLKKLALSRAHQGLRPAIATVLESGRWDVMLAQNPHSAKVFRRSYAFRGPIWQEGYPRDDILRTGDAETVRARLGLPDDVTIVLYAPTWRDDRPDHVDHLDAASFAERLGPGYVTLVRGHSRTLLPGHDVSAPGVLDVTGYPDVSELFLVADLLVTDYSSVMFDFSVTGKPIFFFTPDLEAYRDQLRGFYFDLLPVAPGPVSSSLDELLAQMDEVDAVVADYADRYEAWRRRFNPHDDGGAGERVVRRLIAEGYLG